MPLPDTSEISEDLERTADYYSRWSFGSILESFARIDRRGRRSDVQIEPYPGVPGQWRFVRDRAGNFVYDYPA